ncbi:MarR family transcriptional regulator [Neoasaia chiangmaiensis NBRC 101099]|uniref:HxlR family transcriptional regulator n=1 Tax=Neoasaia chiangmaiensis TaxID=320497 RepID=A0A1U9KSG6_9PROT|nr:helix-turn-helix domain-containing protein [Neoasaia chiangmaiensis]AQS88824.1 HxlR family transcriptional regulator [Neoasaia chiangmaiensis]GBR40681.1 MarR family transcriptional regulator [Neoasaia chiangmaiensis NBRC 101099]GEN13790.1 MarR family transcriptional regulator [Neoasaia chiangmaiensis]
MTTLNDLPAHYREPPFAEDCAPRRILRLFSGKWTTMVLHTLHLLGGSARPGQLMRNIPGLSKKMMTQTLRELESAGLVSREVRQVMPPHVDYCLTSMGELVVEPINMLYDWAVRHADTLDRIESGSGSGTNPA